MGADTEINENKTERFSSVHPVLQLRLRRVLQPGTVTRSQVEAPQGAPVKKECAVS